jgi:WD40 repeat protein
MLPPESARPPRKVGACPYKGLAAFQEADAQFYFGRETFVEALEQAVTTRKFVAVILGSSGSGKSSAIYAGLLPRLRKVGGYQFTTFRPGTQPFYSMAAALVPLLEPNLSRTDRLTEIGKLAEQLKLAKEVHLSQVIENIKADSSSTRQILLVVDQFEELYTMCSDVGLQKAFIDELLALVDASKSQLKGMAIVLLTMRADFMGQALIHRPFADALQEATLLMGPMNRQELHTAIEKPAELQGATFEPGLMERILDDVGEKPGNLPLLEFTLTQLWERQTDGWLTHTDYETLGCVEGALAAYADQVYADLDADEQERARHAFVQLVQPGEGTEDTRRIATHEELGDESWMLIQHLADKRLVVTGRDAQGHETAEVVHEALIQRWGLFKEWMDSDRAFRLWQERLRGSLRQWQDSGQDEGALLAGAPMAVAQGWLSERGSELNPTERGYIHASQALQVKQQKERQRRRQWTVIGLSAGLVIAIILTAFALYQRQNSIIQRKEAETQRQAARRQVSVGLAAQALAELEGTQSERAVLLALEALENYPYTPQAEAALAQAVQETLPYRELQGDTGGYGFKALEWSPDGRWIATSLWAEDQRIKPSVQIWEVATGKVKVELPIKFDFNGGSSCSVVGMAWSPDSSRLAVVSNNISDAEYDCHSLEIYDARSGELSLKLESHRNNSVDWSSDGSMLLSGDEDGVTRLYDTNTGELLREMPGHSLQVNIASFSPDATRLATSSNDGTVIIRNTKDGETMFIFGEPVTDSEIINQYSNVAATSLAWSPDGSYLAGAFYEGLVRIWDTRSGRMVLSLVGNEAFISDVEWSPDGRYLATQAFDNSIRLWEAGTGKQLLTLPGSWRAVEFSPNSRNLIAAYMNLRIWDLTTLPPIMPYPPDPLINMDIHWSPDGNYLAVHGTIHEASVGYRGTPVLLEGPIGWSPDSTRLVGQTFYNASGEYTVIAEGAVADASTGKILIRLKTPPPTDGIYFSSSWSPDSTRVASTAYPGSWTVIWDPLTGEELARTPTYNCFLMRPSFSPDSQLLATGCNYAEDVDTPVRIFSAFTGELVRELPSQDGWSFSPVWSSDGKYLAVTYSKSMVRIFDTSTWQVVQSFASHTGEVWDINWSPDGKRLVSGDINGMIYVWDFATGQVVQSFTTPSYIWHVDWSPDGKLVGAASDQTLTLRRAWQSTQDLINYARQCCVMRELTQEERTQFGLP